MGLQSAKEAVRSSGKPRIWRRHIQPAGSGCAMVRPAYDENLTQGNMNPRLRARSTENTRIIQQMGRRIMRVRKASGIHTAAELAEMVGVDGDTIRNWETGRNAPKYPELVKLCKELGVTIDYIVAGNADGLSEEARVRLAL